MPNIINLPWISKTIDVIDSSDPSLVGLAGMVLDETKRTVKIETCNGEKTLAKNTIIFRIGNEVIDGSLVGQRAEDRIGKRYRRQ